MTSSPKPNPVNSKWVSFLPQLSSISIILFFFIFILPYVPNIKRGRAHDTLHIFRPYKEGQGVKSNSFKLFLPQFKVFSFGHGVKSIFLRRLVEISKCSKLGKGVKSSSVSLFPDKSK